jgi:hypothetical protein
MKSNLNVWAIVGIVAVVGLIAGIVGASITGNVIRSYDYKTAPNQVYTKQEVDAKFSTNQGVLNMLSNCTFEESNNSVNNYCAPSCKRLGKIAIGSSLFVSYMQIQPNGYRNLEQYQYISFGNNQMQSSNNGRWREELQQIESGYGSNATVISPTVASKCICC